MKTAPTYIRQALGIVITWFFASVLTAVFGMFIVTTTNGAILGLAFALLCAAVFVLLCGLWYLVKKQRGRLSEQFVKTHALLTFALLVISAAMFVIARASLLHPAMSVVHGFCFIFLPVYLLMELMSGTYCMFVFAGVVLVSLQVILWLLTKQRRLLVNTVVGVLCMGVALTSFLNSPNHKYSGGGHGFEYMHGYSSTDLSDYTPYSDSGKLATLPDGADFVIENVGDMPILDGAEACYPLYSAVAKAIYKDIDIIEKNHVNDYKGHNGAVVTFTNSSVGYYRLFDGEVDMFFGAKPSASQLEEAKEMGVELVYTPIGKEAFVFFVNEDNPVENLTAEQIKSIYHGDITNWKQVGGDNEKIIAFQRPERSGSQAMMTYFMGDVSLKEPVTYEMQSAMSGIISQVAEYHNEGGAIGYSFRYFFEELSPVEGTKMLSVDGVYPSTENIKNGSYPVVSGLYCVTVKGNKNENVQKVIDFLLSVDGQYLVEQSGYSPIK